MVIKRLGFVTCLLIIILMLVCSQVPPYSASESTIEAGHNLKPALLQANQTFKLHADSHEVIMEADKGVERGQEKVLIVDVDDDDEKVVKKTKGTYGGGDLLRPRTKASGAQPNCLLKSSFIFSAALSLLPLLMA